MLVPRYYQQNASDAAFNYVISGATGNPVIAMPTGTGKKIVIGDLNRRFKQIYPTCNLMNLTHVKELVKQNSEGLLDMWPDAPIGVFSAGLKRKEHQYPIIFGGVKSVANKLNLFLPPDIILIDEVHLLSPDDDTQYQDVIRYYKSIKPWLKIIGLTATPYRTGQGLLTDGENPMFTDIVYDDTTPEGFSRLINEGYLSPPIPKSTRVELNVKGVGLSNGDFAKGQLEAAVDKADINYAACREIIEFGADRQCWLIFAAGVGHAEHIATIIRSFGISCVAVHSKMGDTARDKAIADFKDRRIRCIVNNNVLTTGFDHPPIDLIGMLRPTISTGLWIQMLGRGTRPSPLTNKQNCLVLDFAGNRKRLGPIDRPNIPRPGMAGDGVCPTKICEHCGVYNHAAARVCEYCGAEFPIQTKVEHTADTQDLITSDVPKHEWFNVDRVTYNKHEKLGKPPSMKVTYVCKERRSFNEWISFESADVKARAIARQWWKFRMGSSEAPPNTDEALLWAKDNLAVPKRIKVWTNAEYPRVIDYAFI